MAYSTGGCIGVRSNPRRLAESVNRYSWSGIGLEIFRSCFVAPPFALSTTPSFELVRFELTSSLACLSLFILQERTAAVRALPI